MYRQSISLDIETMATNDPNEFWNKINRLGSRKVSTIPVQIVDRNGNTENDENAVFDRWKLDFENLYNSDDTNDFDSVHYERSKLHTHLMELNMLDPLYNTNQTLNRHITIEEIAQIVMHAKSQICQWFRPNSICSVEVSTRNRRHTQSIPTHL